MTWHFAKQKISRLSVLCRKEPVSSFTTLPCHFGLGEFEFLGLVSGGGAIGLYDSAC